MSEQNSVPGPEKRGIRGRIRMRTVIQLVVGVAILLWLLQLANIGETFNAILQANLLYLMGAAVCFILASALVGLALYVPLKESNPHASISRVVLASFGGQLLSDVTPARSGYFITPVFVNRLAGIPVEQGMTGVLATGSINALLKAVICSVGLGYFITFLPLPAAVVDSLIVGIAVLLIGGSVLLLLMWEKRMSRFVLKLEKLPLIGKKLGVFTGMFADVQKEGQKVKRSLIAVALLIFLSLAVNAAALYLIFGGLWQSSLSLLDFFLMACFASALTYVPITIAGLGVQETGYVLVLSLLLGLPLTAVDPRLLAFALITRALFTGTDIIGLGPLIKVGLKPDAAKTSPLSGLNRKLPDV
ncbi:MAG: flippase-like domain-containing protein [Candidatus Bathyarchaeota archaeon]|nr:flippase-like domain-containing protein [Candidatus Bathyarchaeota archaeon]